MTDEQLAIYAKAASQGDETAFEQILTALESHIYNYTYHLLKNAEDAQDATQDTFIKVWKTLPTFQYECKVYSWVITIAHNICVNMLKYRDRHKTEPTYYTDTSGEEKELDFVDESVYSNPVRALEQKTAVESVHKALHGLPDELREALILCEMQGLSSVEAAAIIGITPENVRVRVHRAKIKLKKLLGHL